MSAVTRWVQYDITEEGSHSTGPGTEYGRGTRGSSIAVAAVGDSFEISTGQNKLWLTIDGVGSAYGIVLASGTDLDPRFVAKDISEKMHDAAQGGGWDHAQCFWNNGQLEIYSGTPGSSSSVSVASGTDTAHLELGWSTLGAGGGTGGLATGNGNAGNYITSSGTYNGFFDEEYRVVVNIENSIQTPVKDGSNTYTGTITTGGIYNHNAQFIYTIDIDTSGGRTTMNAGTGQVPIMTWVSTPGGDSSAGDVELLFADHWYQVGTKGLMVKFSDAIFNTTSTAWDITCNAVQYAQGGNTSAAAGIATFVWGSNRSDDITTVAVATDATGYTELGSRGVYIKWTTVADLTAGDEWRVICKPPPPASYGITNLNYGNVTVSTESPMKAVMFEILSGAVEISTVKFGVQAHGNFNHHGEGNGDTYFRFGTLGPGANGGLSPLNGYEWYANVTANDIVAGTSFFAATDPQLTVVADADSSEALGVSTDAGMVADPIWLNIKLGTSEVGANSTINYRIYFDYA